MLNTKEKGNSFLNEQIASDYYQSKLETSGEAKPTEICVWQTHPKGRCILKNSNSGKIPGH